MTDVVNGHPRQIDCNSRNELRRALSNREVLRPEELLLFSSAIRAWSLKRLPPKPRLTKIWPANSHTILDEKWGYCATGAGVGTANSNCASQPSCAQMGLFRVKGRWNLVRLHFLQVNCPRKALNSSQRAFSSPIEPSP